MQDSFELLLEKTGEVGYVEEVVQSLVQVTGLPGAKLWEVVTFENGQQGLVMALWEEKVEVLIFSRVPMRVGTRAARTGVSLVVSVGEPTLGKIVDGLGRGSLGGETREVNVTPSGITTRKKISRQMETGVVMVDLLIPVGWGQRELIIGDRKTGKTHLILQALLSAAKAGKVCIYVAIGKEKRDIKRSHEFFIKEGVMGQIVLVSASSHDSLGEIYLAPYVGMTIAEYFRDLGRDVLLVLDDMTAHAVFYRELSLLARRFPGRDSYPGDIFHVHSKLLERAGNFAVNLPSGKQGEAAITCLPVIDTVAGDITGYIQTNLMSMTDGHIYFDSEMHFTGRRPAINPFLSVTRVGRQTQSKLQRKLATEMVVALANYEKTQAFVRFGAELGEAARQILAAGERIQKFLSQGQFGVISIPVQTAGAALVLGGLWEEVDKMQKAYETDKAVRTVIDEIAAKAATTEEAIKLGGSLIHEQ